MKPRAFTIVELLVVLSITALLLGLLLPALSSARAGARAATCASNIRQLSLANLTYAADHRGRLAPGASDFLANLHRWFGSRASVYEPFEAHGGPLSPYLNEDGRVRACPESPAVDPQPTDFERGCGGYGYNNAYLGVSADGDDRAGAALSRIAAPFATLMFADAALAVRYPGLRLIEYSFAEPPRHADQPDASMDPTMHFRHRDLATIAWADGHTSGEPFAFTAGNIYGVTEAEMSEFRIGWFGDQDNRAFDLD